MQAPCGGQLGGVLRVLAAATAMGTLGPVSATAFAEGIEPATLSALRAGIGAAILGALVWSGREPAVRLATLPRRQLLLLGMAVAINGVMNLALFLAFGAMAVGLAMILFYCNPVLVAVISAAMGRDPLTRLRLVALVIAGAGLVLILGDQLGPAAHATAAGIALAAFAAACHAVYLVIIRGGFDAVPATQATSLVLAGGLAISGSAALAMHGTGVVGPWLASPVAWLAIGCVATVGALPKAWIMRGVRQIGSTRAAICLLLEPAVAVVVAAVALGQILTLTELAGGGLVLLAVVLVQVPARGAPEPATVSAA